MGGKKPDNGPMGGPSNAYAAVYAKVIMLCAELAIDSVRVTLAVTVAVVKFVVVEYCSTVVTGELFLDGTKARLTARARRHTVVRIRATCRFILRVPPSSTLLRHYRQN